MVAEHLVRKGEIGPEESTKTLMDYCLTKVPVMQQKIYKTEQAVSGNHKAMMDLVKKLDKQVNNTIPLQFHGLKQTIEASKVETNDRLVELRTKFDDRINEFQRNLEKILFKQSKEIEENKKTVSTQFKTKLEQVYKDIMQKQQQLQMIVGNMIQNESQRVTQVAESNK